MTILYVLGAALGGAFVRAAASERPTWTRQSCIDTVMGALISVAIYLLLGVLPWTAPTMAKLDQAAEQVLVVGPFSFMASHLWVNRGSDWLAALGDKLTGRAAK